MQIFRDATRGTVSSACQVPLTIKSVLLSHLTELHAACDATLAFCNSTSFLQMWPYTCMVLIFYSTPAMFFCDATMHIYEDSTALEPHYC